MKTGICGGQINRMANSIPAKIHNTQSVTQTHSTHPTHQTHPTAFTGVILRKIAALLLMQLTLLALFFSPAQAAQPPDNDAPGVVWDELQTEHFVIVYADSVEGLSIFTCKCGLDEARFYANFADDLYEDLVAVFGAELETPINLRLFPTEQSYFQVNPLAEQITGVVAHALNNRAEIAIALPRTEPLTDEEIINNVRHELTHFFASLLSDGNLTTGFQEGIAQYLEQPTATAGYDPTILRQALEQRRLLPWADIDRPGQVWRDPQVAYPQALSMAAFLIDRYGFPAFINFITAHATEPGYRTALQTTYGKSADELEAEWLAYLPEYFAGRWQINAIYSYDLSRVTRLVEQGAYSDAETELTGIIELLETTEQTDTLAQAEALLARVHQGRAAGSLSDDARRALQAHDYPLTVDKATAAISAYEALGYYERLPELQIYIQRAQIGQDALNQLEHGSRQLNTLQFLEAEPQIRQATIMLQSLNNQAGALRGAELLTQLDFRRSLLAYAMLSTALLLLLANFTRRLAIRFSANPLEVEFT